MQITDNKKESELASAFNQHEKSDEQALEHLQFACRRKVMSILSQIISEAEAQEVFQEAILKVFLIAKQNPADTSMSEKLRQLTPLLFTVAKNLALSKARHKQVRERYIENEAQRALGKTAESLESMLVKEKEQELLSCAINSLPPICQKIFIERKIKGKTHSEIADTFNISKKTVENHISKGLKLCRDYMLKQHSKHFGVSSSKKDTSKKSA